MQTNEVNTCAIEICIAGDYDQARQACREFCCGVGLCVTVTATTEQIIRRFLSATTFETAAKQ